MALHGACREKLDAWPVWWCDNWREVVVCRHRVSCKSGANHHERERVGGCLSRPTLSEQGCWIQVCGTTVRANRWCSKSIIVLIHRSMTMLCLPQTWSS